METGGDKWEGNVKSGQRGGPQPYSEHPGCTGWETSGGKWETILKSCGERIESGGDKWETSAKSCGPKHSEHPDCTGTSGGQVGVKPGDDGETSAKSCGPKHSGFFFQENKPGDKRQIIRPEHAPLSKE